MIKILFRCKFWNPFWDVPDTQVENLRHEFPDVVFEVARDQERVMQLLPDSEIMFGYRLDPPELEAAKKLKWIHIPAANVFQFIQDDFRKRNIVLTNARGLHATAIAEHVIGTMLVFSRKFMECWRFQQQPHYGAYEILNHQPPLSELRGKTIFIMGFGNIGKAVAQLANAFGMRILASRNHPSRSEPAVETMFGPDDFRSALPEADYVVITMARTLQNDGLIDDAELSMMKPSCVLINVARSAIINTQALINALRNNKIRGAALDVFDQEPLPEDSELFQLPNLFLTPHVSGVSAKEHWPRMFDLFKENLKRYLDGRPLINVVDLNTGY